MLVLAASFIPNIFGNFIFAEALATIRVLYRIYNESLLFFAYFFDN